jgi:hypothetical protein
MNLFLDLAEAGFEASRASYSTGIEGSFSGVKGQEREADQLPPSSSEVKNDGAMPPIPNTSSWRSV